MTLKKAGISMWKVTSPVSPWIAVPIRCDHRCNAFVQGAPVARIEQRIDLPAKQLQAAVNKYLSGFDE